MDAVKKVLWTGGWDSTFRVLQIALIEKTYVQPYYIIDPFRWSGGYEFKAMSNIKKAVSLNSPESSKYILPTIFFDKTDIHHDDEVSSSFAGFNNSLGGQYEWLSTWAKQEGVNGIDLLVVKNDHVVGCLAVIKDYLAKTESGYVIDEKYAGTPVYNLFRYFFFPLLDVSKPDMRNVAREHHFENILNLSWFCHRPTFFSKPCGTCNPCRATYERGLGDRLGVYGNIRYKLFNLLDLHNYIKPDSFLYSRLKAIRKYLRMLCA